MGIRNLGMSVSNGSFQALILVPAYAQTANLKLALLARIAIDAVE